MLQNRTIALLAAAAWLGACREGAAPAPGGAASPPSVRAPLHLKALPEGWRADSDGAGRVLRAGPAGRPVLRVEFLPGLGKEFPSAAALEASFTRALPGAVVRRVPGGEERADFVAVRLEVLGSADGGSAPSRDIFLGARRMGADLYLCASEPGASDPEMDDAQEGCRDFSAP